MSNWRGRCRECDAPTAKGRAWCQRHLVQVRAGRPTDLESIPSYDEAKAIDSGSSDRPFPFWPTTTTLTKA